MMREDFGLYGGTREGLLAVYGSHNAVMKKVNASLDNSGDKTSLFILKPQDKSLQDLPWNSRYEPDHPSLENVKSGVKSAVVVVLQMNLF